MSTLSQELAGFLFTCLDESTLVLPKKTAGFLFSAKPQLFYQHICQIKLQITFPISRRGHLKASGLQTFRVWWIFLGVLAYLSPFLRPTPTSPPTLWPYELTCSCWPCPSGQSWWAHDLTWYQIFQKFRLSFRNEVGACWPIDKDT